jgi:hypothetical protein
VRLRRSVGNKRPINDQNALGRALHCTRVAYHFNAARASIYLLSISESVHRQRHTNYLLQLPYNLGFSTMATVSKVPLVWIDCEVLRVFDRFLEYC